MQAGVTLGCFSTVIPIREPCKPCSGMGLARDRYKAQIFVDLLTCRGDILSRVQGGGLGEDGNEVRGVFTVSAGKARFVPVETGIIGGLDIEVRGLADQAEVIAGPYQVLRDLEDGAQVRAR